MAASASYTDNVFINCPFDSDYHPLFESIIFTIIDCGFRPRCALEENNSGNIRIEKIMKIIDECKFGIHDISKADLDKVTGLARFNMPLELGLFFGAQRYSSAKHYNKEKRTLIMDHDGFRYRNFISDLGGYDISAHHSQPAEAVKRVRDFLANHTRRISVAGGDFIFGRFEAFLVALSGFCSSMHWNRTELTFLEFVSCVEFWIEDNPI